MGIPHKVPKRGDRVRVLSICWPKLEAKLSKQCASAWKQLLNKKHKCMRTKKSVESKCGLP